MNTADPLAAVRYAGRVSELLDDVPESLRLRYDACAVLLWCTFRTGVAGAPLAG